MLQRYQKDPGFCEMQCISSTALHHLLLSEPGRYNDAASRGNCWLAHQEGRGALATTIHERQRKKGNEKHKMNIPIKEQVSVSSQCILLSVLLRKLFRNVLQCCVVLLRQSSRVMFFSNFNRIHLNWKSRKRGLTLNSARRAECIHPFHKKVCMICSR